MVGLSVILENYKDLAANKTTTHQVISKGISMIKPSSPTTTSPPSFYKNNNNNGTCFSRRNNSTNICTNFLEYCFLCKQKLLPAKDIYMYKGDKAFCSVECRCRQIFMDEEESTTSTTAAAKSGCTREYNSSPSSSRSGKGTRNRANNNAFAY